MLSTLTVELWANAPPGFRSFLTREAGTRANPTSLPSDVHANTIVCQKELSVLGLGRTVVDTKLGIRDLNITDTLQATELNVETLLVDEIVTPVLLDAETTTGASFLDFDESWVEIFRSDNLHARNETEWQVRTSGPSLILQPLSDFESHPRWQTCGGLDILGGPCLGGNVELYCNFSVGRPSDNGGTICGDFKAHFFDLWPTNKGQDIVYARVDGTVVWLDSHASASPNSTQYDLGPRVCGHPRHPDTKINQHVHFCVPHRGPFMTITFGGQFNAANGLGDSCEHSWGISDIVLRAFNS